RNIARWASSASTEHCRGFAFARTETENAPGALIMAQDATATHYNRYPGTFRTVQLYAGCVFGGRPLGILSFGCSHGLELATLKACFPDASIFGCDVNESALADAARVHDSICVFKSVPEAIRAFGPFDIVFAMSV